MNLKEFQEKFKKRIASDNKATFCYRIIFFLFRKCLEIYDMVVYKFITSYKDDFILKEIQGSKMFLNKYDIGLSKELLLAGYREPCHTKLFKKVLKDGDVVIDIGANIGYYTLMEARAVGKKGRVYAIEPVQENIKLLRDNVALNNFFNVEIFEIAIGNENKLSNILLSKKKNWCAIEDSYNKENFKNITEKAPVTMITLDSFVQGKRLPSLIRMDVEGYETQIIKGMQGILNGHYPLKVFMELHSSVLADKGISILRIFENNGFRIKYFFRERPPLMLNKNSLIRTLYYFLGRKINGIYEFCYKNIAVDEIIKKNIITNETFHVYFERL